jgi:hypothetical protein
MIRALLRFRRIYYAFLQWVYVRDDMSKELKNYVSRSDQSRYVPFCTNEFGKNDVCSSVE